MKSVHVWSFSGSNFPAFGLNAERYPYSDRIQGNTDQKNSKYGHFFLSEKDFYVFKEYSETLSFTFSQYYYQKSSLTQTSTAIDYCKFIMYLLKKILKIIRSIHDKFVISFCDFIFFSSYI